MIFESRELKPWADFVPISDLKVGAVYFHLLYLDDDMLIPEMEPLIFIGRNLHADDVDRVYFQDLDSYGEGRRYDDKSETPPDTQDEVLIQSFPEKTGQVSAIYEFESALECLMRCSLRRREKAQL
jgi:hypothetical protein